jgi:hypothetical protein
MFICLRLVILGAVSCIGYFRIRFTWLMVAELELVRSAGDTPVARNPHRGVSMRHNLQEINQGLSVKPQPEVMTVARGRLLLNHASASELVQELIQAGSSGSVGRVVAK